MAFLGKVRGMIQHKLANNIGREVSASTPLLFQAIRCMSSKIFVGGLSYQTTEDTLYQTFEKYGQVYEARIIFDRETGRSRGFGFVTFENSEAASSAIMALDGQDLDGRRLKVNHAHDRGQGFGGGRSYNNASGNFGVGGGYGNFGGDSGSNYQGGGAYNNYPGGGNYQGGGGYGNYQDGGSYPGGGGYNNHGGGNYQGDQANLSNSLGGDGGYGTTGGGGYNNNYATGSIPNSGGNLDSSGNFTSANVGYGGPSDQTFGVPSAFDNYNVDEGNGGSNFARTAYEKTTSEFNHEDGSTAYENEPDEYQDRRAS